MIGQLYASRVLPVLIVSVATLISGCLLPYLIQDWELGRRQALHERMNGVVKFSAIGFTAIAALTHIISPVLFTWLLRGKYEDGLSLMPWAFVQYTWFSLLAIAAKYLICVDRPRTGIWPLLAGLLSSLRIGGSALAAVFGNLVLMPIVAFYLLLDWGTLVERLKALVPPRWRDSVRGFVDETDQVPAEIYAKAQEFLDQQRLDDPDAEASIPTGCSLYNLLADDGSEQIVGYVIPIDFYSPNWDISGWFLFFNLQGELIYTNLSR